MPAGLGRDHRCGRVRRHALDRATLQLASEQNDRCHDRKEHEAEDEEAEEEFVILASEGRTIKTVIPNVPYFDDLYVNLTFQSDSMSDDINDAWLYVWGVLLRICDSNRPAMVTAEGYAIEPRLYAESLLRTRLGHSP